MDKTPPPRLQPGDRITALPIPREVTAVRGVHPGGSHSRYVWDRRHDGWRARIEGGARVSADAMLTEYPGGLLVVEVAPEAAPEPTPDVEPEPPIRAKRTGCTGSVWTRFPEGWWVMKRAENAPHCALTWEQVQAQGPLREPRPGDVDRNPEPTPEPLPTVTDTDGGTWVEVGPDRWRMVRALRLTLESVRKRWGGTTASDGRTHTDNDGDVWVLLPDGWAIAEPNTERPRADIPGFQPTPDVEPEPPIRAKRTDCTDSVWTRFPEGWWGMPRAENAPHIALTWEQVQAQGPLREPRPGDRDLNPELARMTLADMATAAASVPAARRAVLDVDGQHFTVHVATHAAFARYVGPEPRMTPDGDLVLTDQWDAEYVTTCTIAWTPEHTPGGVL